MEIINIGSNDKGQRLDAFMKKIMPDSPVSLIYRYIRTNKIKLNGKKPKPDTRILEGDIISYYGDSSSIRLKKFEPSDFTLDVIYEDENILVVNKPSGMACQPDIKHTKETLIDNVKNYLYSKGDYKPSEENSFSPALCNRIDFNTAGLLIAAKNAQSLRIINDKLKNREIRRFYMCVTEGVPEKKEGIIKNRILKNAAENKSYITGKGKETETRYKVIMEGNRRALVEAEIVSGRAHQIRLHMSSIGCPVLSDAKYGNGGEGQKLISYKTIFEFSTDAGVLNYLNGRSCEIPTSELHKYL